MSNILVREDFDSISELLKTINERPKNEYMRNKNSSQTGTFNFTGTHSYSEAVELLYLGYTDPIPKIKQSLREQKKLMTKMYSLIPHPTPHNHVAGFIPNIPNALRGLPNSMITIDKQNQKRKTLSLIYAISGSAGQNQDYFIKAGTAIVSAINLIETAGIQTELKLAFMPCQENNEIVLSNVKIKSFGERFNLQKICFPLIHPSMFRRIGFRYLETCPLTKQNFSWGYGHPPNINDIRELITDKDTYVINTGWIAEHDNSIEEILKEVGVLNNYGN